MIVGFCDCIRCLVEWGGGYGGCNASFNSGYYLALLIDFYLCFLSSSIMDTRETDDVSINISFDTADDM